MEHERGYSKKDNEYMILSYVNFDTIDYLEDLYKIAKKDFPKIKRKDVAVVFANNKMCGIKFRPAQEEQPVA